MSVGPAHARLSIGEALARLKADFPDEDIKESKIRFLEAEGLVRPDRTPSGYRKYSEEDMERLRYVLRAQRQYLPLKVIREQLEALDRGEQPAGPDGEAARGDGLAGGFAGALSAAPERLSRRELLKTAGIDDELLDQLEDYGLVRPRGGSRSYDTDALGIATVAAELAAFGIEPRHLRAFRTAAEREVALVDQVTTPLRRSRDDGAVERAEDTTQQVAALCVRLHTSLVKVGLRGLR